METESKPKSLKLGSNIFENEEIANHVFYEEIGISSNFS